MPSIHLPLTGCLRTATTWFGLLPKDLAFGATIPLRTLISFSTWKAASPAITYSGCWKTTIKNLWISTTRGLVCMNMHTNTIKVYTKANGLLSDQFNYNSAFKDDDGTMYFGCVKGMVSFNPSAFKENKFTAPVYITGFQVQNQEVSVKQGDSLLSRSIISTKQINLNYTQSSFSIDFAALSFPSPEMTQYKYFMKGLDKTWTKLKRNRKVYFTELQPGHYTFIVKAANNSGVWTTKETRLEIDISPPYWASPWAYMLYAILLMLTLYYLLAQYHKQTRQKNKRLIEILENDKGKADL